MAIAKVKDGGSNIRTSTGTTLVLTVPAGGHAVGNLVVILVTTTVTGSMTATDNATGGPNTWTWASSSVGAVNCGFLWTIVTAALAAGNTITVTMPSGSRAAAISAEFSGVVTTTPRDKLAATATGTSTHPVSATSGVLAQADELVIGACASSLGTNTTTGTKTPDAGYSNLTAAGAYAQASSTGRGIDGVYRIVAATTALTAGVTWTPSIAWDAELVTFKAAAGASSAVKTIEGLANASVKTMMGLARASVKTVTGVA